MKDDELLMLLAYKVWDARSDRRTHPEGTFDDKGRWYPSPREDAGGDVQNHARAPSVAHKYSYMLRARTKAHCTYLVRRAVVGSDVPPDVWSALGQYVLLVRDDSRHASYPVFIHASVPGIWILSTTRPGVISKYVFDRRELTIANILDALPCWWDVAREKILSVAGGPDAAG